MPSRRRMPKTSFPEEKTAFGIEGLAQFSNESIDAIRTLVLVRAAENHVPKVGRLQRHMQTLVMFRSGFATCCEIGVEMTEICFE